ncbi:hypothetical protein [Haloarcula marismortui]|uniref:DUF7964 domain-containing protein n=1 Tax=Haloarcula marismortui ATCC 33799 TaxID=662475 RepID=M0KYX6_9EURY|nr:hypothetical protein [Haloarcula californiae]EMA25429.1 hypothetical protein C435_02512 [Haloarcula californiae ATCC 33799]
MSSSTLRELEEHDAIRAAMPMMARFHGDQEVADRVVLQTDAAAVVAGYGDDAWMVEHRVDGKDRDPDDVFEEAMFHAQAEQEMVVDEMEEMADSHTEVEIDPDAAEDH